MTDPKPSTNDILAKIRAKAAAAAATGIHCESRNTRSAAATSATSEAADTTCCGCPEEHCRYYGGSSCGEETCCESWLQLELQRFWRRRRNLPALLQQRCRCDSEESSRYHGVNSCEGWCGPAAAPRAAGADGCERVLLRQRLIRPRLLGCRRPI